MKCPKCGAEIKDGSKFCEYCGSQITADMKREQEYVNKAGCPSCGSSNIIFNREKQGEVKGKKGSAVVRATIGMCKDCGHTWQVQAEPDKKRKTWLWVLGWIFIFPLPLTILMLRPTTFPKLDKKIKYGIIALAWIIYAIWLIGSKGSDKNTTADTTTDATPVVETTVVDEKTTVEVKEVPVSTETHLYDNAEIRDVMNGSRDTKLGEMAVIKADSKDCTEEAIADIYYNFFKKNDFNWITLIYTDKNDNTGIYFNTSIIGVNDQFEVDEYGDYSAVISPDEILYVPSGDGKTLTKMEFEKKEPAEETTEKKEEPAEEATAEKEETNSVSPDLKAFLDSYEAFINQYCRFMENYDASDPTMLLEYAEMLTKYADFAGKAEAYDSDTMSDADRAYYLEVMARVEAKLAKVAYTE